MSPAVQQRRLRTELRRLREAADLTQQRVANELEWSLSKVIRIENGVVGVTLTDLRALLQLYGVTDQARVAELATMARASRQEGWWDQYRNVFNRRFITFLGLESSAVTIRQFHQIVIPGLLQTPDYARAALKVWEATVDDINLGVGVRQDRQRLLTQQPGPKMFFIVDEAAIRRQVGGQAVMQAQLLRLKELNQRDDISIQIVPFNKGAHVGMRASFEILEFTTADDEYDHAVYLDLARNSVLIQNSPEETTGYVEDFYALEEIATPKAELTSIIDSIVAESYGSSNSG